MTNTTTGEKRRAASMTFRSLAPQFIGVAVLVAGALTYTVMTLRVLVPPTP